MAKTKNIPETLRRLRIRDTLRGHLYIKIAVELLMKDRRYENAITTRLYPDIADMFGTKNKCVETAMTYAFTQAWMYGDPELLEDLVGYRPSKRARRPSSGTFLDALVIYHLED